MDDLTRNCLLKFWDAWKWPVDGRNGPGGKIGNRMKGGLVEFDSFCPAIADWASRVGGSSGLA